MNRYKNYGIALLTGALLLAGFAGNALAVGTPACTPISNQATLSYSVGGVSQTAILSDGDAGTAGVQTTDFKVATKVDLTVATVNSPKTATGVDQVLTYSITNAGNDTQRYALELYTGAGETYGGETDDFDMGNVRVYTDTNSTFVPALTDGETLVANLATFRTANVAANGVLYVHIVADVPGGQGQGDDAMYTLKARTYQIAGRNGADGNDGTETGNSSTAGDLTTNGCGPSTGVALADGDKDLTDSAVGGATDGANDGDSYATGYYTVATASISVTKTAVTLWDPVNGDSTGDDPIAIPGAYVTYTLTIANTGASSATLSQIVDDLQADLDLDADFFTGADLTPADGPYTNGAATRSVKIDNGGTSTRPDSYGTAFAVDTDGVAYGGNPGGVLTVYFTASGGSGTVLPAGGGYLEGELKPGENVAISFNVIIK